MLVLKHFESEGPGALEAFLESHGVDVVALDLSGPAHIPGDPGKAAAIVSPDGAMSGSLKEGRRLLREAVRMGVPVLGIGLGAELLAGACGAEVTGRREMGFFHVRLTPEGQKEPLFDGFEDEFEVFAQRKDTFPLPEGAVLLAEADECQNQAFRYGPCAYGFQFPLEVTPRMVAEWFEHRPEKTEVLRVYHRIANRLNRMAHMLWLNFLGKIMRFSASGQGARR